MKLLNYEDFTQSIKENLQTQFDEDVKININQVTKNNNLKLDGLVIISPGQVVSPTIYLNPLYEEYKSGLSLDAITKKINETYANAKVPEFAKEADRYTDYDFVKEHLAIKLINYERNKETLENSPHIRRLDLALVFLCVIDKDDKQSASVLIKNSHLKFWNIDTDTLFADALINAPTFLKPNCYSLFKTVYEKKHMELMELDEVRLDDDDLLILTNENKVNGASCIFYPGVLEKIATKLDSDLYIIPSSIHEVLILRKTDNIKKDDLNFLINTVNQSELAQTEILSDNVYIYDFEDKILTK